MNVDFQSLGFDALGEDALTFLCAAIVVYPTCHYFNLSPLVGFLGAGCILKQAGLFAESEDTTALADFGVLCLLFQIGLELTVDRISRLARYAINLGLPALLVSTVIFAMMELPPGNSLGTQILEVLGGSDAKLVGINTWVEALVIGLGLSLSSSAFVLQLLRERDELSSHIGNAVVGVLLIQDIAVVPLLVLLPVIEGLQDPSSHAVESTAGMLTLLTEGIRGVLFLGLVVMASRVAARPFLGRLATTFGERSDALTTGVIFTVAIASLLTKLAGFSDSLGAFLIGTLLADSRHKHRIEEALQPFRGLLLGLFFVTVGAALDLDLLQREFRSIFVLLTGLLAIKATVLVLLGPPLAGLSRAESIRVGLLLAQGGEFAFVVFKLADNLKILPDDLNKVLIIVVVLSIAVTPLLDEVGRTLAATIGDDGPEAGGLPRPVLAAATSATADAVVHPVAVPGRGVAAEHGQGVDAEGAKRRPMLAECE